MSLSLEKNKKSTIFLFFEDPCKNYDPPFGGLLLCGIMSYVET